jgi:hypothetical protein
MTSQFDLLHPGMEKTEKQKQLVSSGCLSNLNGMSSMNNNQFSSNSINANQHKRQFNIADEFDFLN